MIVAWVKVVESQILGWNLRDETEKARIGGLGAEAQRTGEVRRSGEGITGYKST
jgi:hypothetical protein